MLVLRLYEASAVLSRARNTGTLAASEAAELVTELKSLNITADHADVARVLTDVRLVAMDLLWTPQNEMISSLATEISERSLAR